MVGIICPPGVEIGLTDLPKSAGATAPPGTTRGDTPVKDELQNLKYIHTYLISRNQIFMAQNCPINQIENFFKLSGSYVNK